MFEDNSYEPIAEIYVTLSGEPSIDDIYCLCSRVFVDGINRKDENIDVDLNEGEIIEEVVKSANSLESTVRFCNSSFDSHHAHTPKKTHEEAVSCYCSASHYSTDEHDSLRDVSGHSLHHSDSGADLSESSRDTEWEKYWTLHGERLIWESWISKYGSYIDPNYLSNSGTDSNQQPAEGEETSFCVEEKFVESSRPRKTSFSGLLESIKEGEKCENRQNSFQDEEKKEDTPKILVEGAKSEEYFGRRFSDISDTGKSLSGRSEDSNFDDDRLRLSVYSRCSGSSAPLSATTDSMTNVTRITLSSSDSSYNVDDSSAKSSSILSSSDSGSSVDQQWQNLWADHFNEQYYFHYNKFSEKLSKKRVGEESKSESSFIVEETTVNGFHPQRQESVEEVGSIETQDSASQDSDKPPSVTESCKSSDKSKSGKVKNKKTSTKRLLSVGYLLQQLNAMSVEPGEQIQEEDESNSFSKPSIVENTHLEGKDEGSSEEAREELVNHSECLSEQQNNMKMDNSDVRECENVSDTSENLNETVNEDENVDMVEGETVEVRHGVKRTHEKETEESVEKIKSAYQLMGLMYDLENTSKIRKASVWYKKRFSQIRFQNRILRLQKPVNKHIYFDDDDDHNEAVQAKSLEEPKEKNDSDLFEDACEETAPVEQTEFSEPRKLEMEEFSEKDDSSDDDQEIYFSAEEENTVDTSQERRDKFKSGTKRKKKRQSKKKNVDYPDEMIANPKIKKFWHRRYSLFSRFDEGIKMDVESWYSVTPEKIAINIAERCQCDLVVDAFCGAGGNAIQLAFLCERVIAIDIDPCKIELARHNARVYGVEDRIEFIVGDYLQVAPSLVADVVFLSPPWGGVGYQRQGVFPLSSLLPVSGKQLFEVTSNITDNIAFYLPKNVNTQELVECAGPGGSVEVVQNFLDRELVAVTAYFGELVHTVDSSLS